MICKLKDEIIKGHKITREEAHQLVGVELEALCTAADEIRSHFCENAFDICTIINGKSGRCSENCKYCAQSVHYPVEVEEYPMLDTQEIVKEAKYNEEKGILRYSVVTSGRQLTEQETKQVCQSYRAVCEVCGISVCASHGLLSYEQMVKLKEAGVSRYHNNLETSRRYFPNICTTHTYEDKVNTIKAAQKAGLEVCSGGIMGLGETMEDRIDMAFELRELGIRSIPINILNPIKGTPLEDVTPLSTEEVRRIVALYRFILPDNMLRLAGGRGLLPDKGKSVFRSGANAAISGDMLTTSGITIDEDMKLLKSLGYEVKKI